MKKIFSYGLTFLIGMGCALAIIYKWKDIMSFQTPVIQKEEIAQSENAKSSQETHREENIVKLSEEQLQQMGLKFKVAGPGNLFLTLSTRGKIILQPDHLAHIIPKVPGIAQEAYKNIGNFVRTGEVMAILESREIADIKATYLASLSKQKLTSFALEREKKLYEEKVSAGQDYLIAKNAYEEAVINVQVSKQNLRAYGLTDEEINRLANQDDFDLRLYKIRSPIDGIVIARHITKGEFIENTNAIYQVADLSTVWVDIGIYPKDLYKVKEGQMVEVVIPVENKGSQARLIYVSPIVANETITAQAVAELDNPQGFWRPGVFVKVNIATEKVSLPLVISKEAVQSSDGKDFVFILTSKGIEKRSVKLGQSDNENVEITSGLNPGEQYVLNKTFLLKAELEKNEAESGEH